jgi:hypothetical protein
MIDSGLSQASNNSWSKIAPGPSLGVSEEPEPIVTIRAIGIKDRNRIFVGGEEIELS